MISRLRQLVSAGRFNTDLEVIELSAIPPEFITRIYNGKLFLQTDYIFIVHRGWQPSR
jgi:hypothetical protein